jgi:aspartyl-tRNA(Asn)/glutamyl-tRNA(Gln) amidotransferase subunit A
MQSQCEEHEAMTDDLLWMTSGELIAHYRAGDVSPMEVARDMLRRVEDTQPAINAMVHTDAERTLVQARASEDRWRHGEPAGLLDGVPVTIKDELDVAGWPTRDGSRAFLNAPPAAEDSPVVARLREQGAVILGKTAMPEFGCRAVTVSAVHGVTRNPYDLSKTPGGSSGGAAAALALGLGPIAIGTDAGGSVRIPASFCNVFGLKPTFGRVPDYPPSSFMALDVIGPMARRVEDAALAFTVITRPECRDPYALPYEDQDYRAGLDNGVAGLRIAYSPTLGRRDVTVDPEVAAVIGDAAEVFAALGAVVETADPVWPCDPLDVCLVLWRAAFAHFLEHSLNEDQRARIEPDMLALLEAGRELSLTDYQMALNRRAEIAVAAKAFFNTYELLLSPVMPMPPFAADHVGAPGISREDWACCPFTWICNLTRQPAASVPCGFTKAGLPIGLHIVGPLYGEALILRAARAFEQVRPMHSRHPPQESLPESAHGRPAPFR